MGHKNAGSPSILRIKFTFEKCVIGSGQDIFRVTPIWSIQTFFFYEKWMENLRISPSNICTVYQRMAPEKPLYAQVGQSSPIFFLPLIFENPGFPAKFFKKYLDQNFPCSILVL